MMVLAIGTSLTGRSIQLSYVAKTIVRSEVLGAGPFLGGQRNGCDGGTRTHGLPARTVMVLATGASSTGRSIQLSYIAYLSGSSV